LEIATFYNVLPIACSGNILTLAVANPFDILKLDDLRLVTNCELRLVVSSDQAIKRVINRIYNPHEEEIDQLLDTTTEEEQIELHKEADEQLDLSKITQEAEESPIIKFVNMIIAKSLREKCSDIHIEPYEKYVKVRFRQDGILKEVTSPPKRMLSAIVSRIKIMSSLDIAEHRIPQDGKFKIVFDSRPIDFRVSILPTIHGEKVVMRILDSGALALSLEQLGFEPSALRSIRKAINSAWGMILVTGPTGSGKSTTLYSSIKEIMSPEENIVTVEDPVEYQIDGIIQVPVSVKRGLTFATSLRSILRQDPDVIMIGEIRDKETADIAVKAAITGHMVLSTLHTNDAPSSIFRLVDMGIDPFMVTSSVILIAAQRLCRKLCDNCKEPVSYPPERLVEIGVTPEEAHNAKIFKSVGCQRCMNGYKGRFALLEVLEFDDTIQRLVLQSKSTTEIKEHAVKELGMITLRRCGIINLLKGKTTVEEVLRNTMGDAENIVA
jgi:type IV pilus assembly protein PilB